MIQETLTMTRGDDQDFVATFRDADGVLYDINGWTIYLIIKEGEDDSSAVISKNVTVSESPSSGSGIISVVPADTEALAVKGYHLKLKVRTNEDKVYTVLKCTFSLEY